MIYKEMAGMVCRIFGWCKSLPFQESQQYTVQLLPHVTSSEVSLVRREQGDACKRQNCLILIEACVMSLLTLPSQQPADTKYRLQGK